MPVPRDTAAASNDRAAPSPRSASDSTPSPRQAWQTKYEAFRSSWQLRRRHKELAFRRDRAARSGWLDGLDFNQPDYPERLRPAAMEASVARWQETEDLRVAGREVEEVELHCDTVPCSLHVVLSGEAAAHDQDLGNQVVTEIGGALGLGSAGYSLSHTEPVTIELMWNPYDRGSHPFLHKKVWDAWQMRTWQRKATDGGYDIEAFDPVLRPGSQVIDRRDVE